MSYLPEKMIPLRDEWMNWFKCAMKLTNISLNKDLKVMKNIVAKFDIILIINSILQRGHSHF